MNRKKMSWALIVPLILLNSCVTSTETPREPILFTGEIGLPPEMDMDQLISESDVIALGQFESIPPARWNTPTGELPQDATIQIILDEGLFIYTEQVFVPDQILKDVTNGDEMLVRSFGGQVGQDVMTPGNRNEVAYAVQKPYLLFLSYYTDRVDDDTPGYFVATGSPQGVYEIIGERAVSFDDEWNLTELTDHIQKRVN